MIPTEDYVLEELDFEPGPKRAKSFPLAALLRVGIEEGAGHGERGHLPPECGGGPRGWGQGRCCPMMDSSLLRSIFPLDFIRVFQHPWWSRDHHRGSVVLKVGSTDPWDTFQGAREVETFFLIILSHHWPFSLC